MNTQETKTMERTDRPGPWTPRRLEAYRVAVEFFETVSRVRRGLPAGYAFLGDQLARAAASVVLNLSEGAGRKTRADKQRFYGMARGSAMECVGALDLTGVVTRGNRDDLAQAGLLLERVAAMLSRLAR